MFKSIQRDEYKPLKEVCTLITDGTHNPPKFKDSGIPFILVSNITGNVVTYDTPKYISEDDYNVLMKRTPIEKGDVLLSTVGSYGHPAIVTEDRPFAFQRHIAQLKPNRELLTSEFLHAAILSSVVQEQIEVLVLGVAQKTLNLSAIKQIQIPVPTIEEQKLFVTFVEQSDKSKFISFKSQFIEMFGLPECNTHEYEIGTIGDVVKDVHYGTAKKASEDGRYIYIRMNNITYEGELDLTDIKRIDVPEKDLAGCMVQEGDVLFNRTNSKDLVGKTCYFTGDEPMIIAGYIIRLRMNGKVLPEYVSTFMNLDRSKKLLYSMAKGAVGQANINAKEVQSIPIVISPENVQQEFLKLRKQSDKSK